MNNIKQFLTPRADQLNKPKQSYRFCFFFRRMFKLRMAEPPPDIVNLFNEYSDKGVMTVEKLHQFLNDYQGENYTIESAQDVFNSIKHHHVFLRRSLNLDAFFQYLSGDQNPPLAHPGEAHHDMTEPLAHYFLYTGHNSYLTGNQLSSNSSSEPIIQALKSGVRVIELDLWPPSKKIKNDINVYHGKTMTSPVELKKCLLAIRDNAFVASEYPVIITFEDHLNPVFQAKVAQMVTDIFKEMLYPGVEFVQFPSPEELKRRILISTKPPKESLGSFDQQENDDEVDKPIKDNEEEDEEAAVPEYKSLIAIHAHKSKDGLEKMLINYTQRVARLSLSEEELKNAVKTHATDIVKYTQRNLLRVYPKGTRVLSSNYDPLIGWTHGAQMVAFNMQSHKKYLWIMQGMFRANGGCGYVRKPDLLLSDEPFNPSIIGRPLKMILKIKLYMGYGWHLQFPRTHFDPFSPPDFFTKVEIWGVPADIKKDKTDPIEDQWVPVWNKDFEFCLTVPELALLRIEVRENDLDGRHGFGGQTCLPISEIKSGIRAVPLFGKKGEKYEHVKLLMHFQLLLQ